MGGRNGDAPGPTGGFIPQYIIDRLNTLERTCPVCQAKPFEPCHIPTDEGRKDVKWFHLDREHPTENDQEEECPGDEKGN